MSLTRKTATSILWKGSSTALGTGINFVVLAVLANLLAPSDFGLRGIILVVHGFLVMFTDMGLGAALVHEEKISREEFSTLFHLNVLAGFTLTGILLVLAAPIAAFFQEARLTPLLKVMSVAILLNAFGSVFGAQLQKDMRFKTRFQIDLAEAITSGVVSIFLAAQGQGVWSMVYGFLSGVIVRVVLLFLTASFRPRFQIRLNAVRRFMKFGIFVFGEQILNFLSRNLDNIIIGRFLGPEALGYYSLAYSLMLVPVSRITDSVVRVVFPAFSLIQRDVRRLRDGYLKVIRYVAFGAFPLMAGMFAVAPQLMTAVYGPQWQPAVAVLRIFCFVGAIQSVVCLASTIQYAKGRSDIGFKWNIFALVCNTVAFIVGLRWGIVGVAGAYAIAALVLDPALQWITNRLIQLPLRDFLRTLGLPAFGGALIIGTVLAFKAGLGPLFGLGSRALLAWSVAVGVLVYALLIAARGRDLVREAARMIGLGRAAGPPEPAPSPSAAGDTGGVAGAAPRLALVIATKDRPEEIRRLFVSLSGQSRQPEKIIVVDGGSIPVRDVVMSFPGLAVTYRPSRPPSSARQRNLGISLAGPDITLIGFLDDDCVLEDGALATMMDFWATADSDVAGAAFNMTNHPTTEFARIKSHALLRKLGIYGGLPGTVQGSGFQNMIGCVPQTTFVRWLPAGAAIWRREVFRRFRFDDWYDGYGYLEDLDFSYSVGTSRRLAVVAEARYQHLPSVRGRIGSFAFGRKEVRNRLHFARKHREFSLLRCYLTLGLRILVTGALFLREGEWGHLGRIAGNAAALLGL